MGRKFAQNVTWSSAAVHDVINGEDWTGWSSITNGIEIRLHQPCSWSENKEDYL
jgi:hypothetical protein